MQQIGVLILLLGYIAIVLSKRDYDFLLERMEGIPGEKETLIDYSQCRIHRQGINYIADGNMTYNDDLGEDVMHTIKTAYSASGSSQFRAHPYTVQKSSICEFFKTYYRKYGQSWVEGHTNFPIIPEEGLCPLPKGNYYIESLLFDTNKLPDHAPTGLWKIEQLFERNDKLIGGMRLFAKVSPKFD